MINILSLPRFAFRRRRPSYRVVAFLAAWKWSCVQKQWSLLRQVTNATSQGHWLSCLMCPSSQHQVCCYQSCPRLYVLPACSGNCCSDSHPDGRGARRNRLPGERDRGLWNRRHPRTSCPWSQRAVVQASLSSLLRCTNKSTGESGEKRNLKVLMISALYGFTSN